jgi:hypothetical protein
MITAVPTAIFFIGGPHPGDWTVQIKKDAAAPLVQKSHSLQAIYGALCDARLVLARNAQYRAFSRYLWSPRAVGKGIGRVVSRDDLKSNPTSLLPFLSRACIGTGPYIRTFIAGRRT